MSEPNIPSEVEFIVLPRWARVAFAARCARRVLPLARHRVDPALLVREFQTVSSAIDLAERAAAVATANSQAPIFAQAAAVAIPGHGARRMVGQVAAAAAGFAGGSGTVDSGQVHTAAWMAQSAASDTSPDFTRPSMAAIRADYELLAAATKAEGWDDDTPVPPEFFGPLWPEGPPPGWPADSGSTISPIQGSGGLVVGGTAVVSVFPGTTSGAATPVADRPSPLVEVFFPEDEFSPEEVELLLEFVDAVYHETAGGRLVVVDPAAMQPDPAEVPV